MDSISRFLHFAAGGGTIALGVTVLYSAVRAQRYALVLLAIAFIGLGFYVLRRYCDERGRN